MNITGIILSGGKSTRMGTDKGLIPFNGKPMIETVIDHMLPLCNQLLISTNNQEYQKFGFEMIADDYENMGPIAGILSSFPHAKNERILLISCDLPNASTSFLAQLIFLAKDFDITLPVSDGLTQPLCGVYSKKIIDQLKLLVLNGETKLQNLVRNFNLRIIEKKDCGDFDLKIELANMNTKTDILRYKKKY